MNESNANTATKKFFWQRFPAIFMVMVVIAPAILTLLFFANYGKGWGLVYCSTTVIWLLLMATGSLIDVGVSRRAQAYDSGMFLAFIWPVAFLVFLAEFFHFKRSGD